MGRHDGLFSSLVGFCASARRALSSVLLDLGQKPFLLTGNGEQMRKLVGTTSVAGLMITCGKLRVELFYKARNYATNDYRDDHDQGSDHVGNEQMARPLLSSALRCMVIDFALFCPEQFSLEDMVLIVLYRAKCGRGYSGHFEYS